MNDKGISEIFWVLGDLSQNMFVDTTVRHSSSSVLDRQTECRVLMGVISFTFTSDFYLSTGRQGFN